MKLPFKGKFIIGLILIVVVIIGWFLLSSSKNNKQYTVYTVKKGTVSQEVSETGTIRQGDKIALSFKSPGRIKEIDVQKGEQVKKGTVLAQLDNTELFIQLQQARADLDLSQAELQKLLAGASNEEIQVAKTAVNKAKTTLEDAQKGLDNAQATADRLTKDTYQDASNTLNDSFLKLFNALAVVTSLQTSYFTNSDQDSLIVKDQRNNISSSLDEMDFYLEKTETNLTEQNIEFALVNFEKNLFDCRNYLNKIREIVEKPNYRNTISSTDKTSLDTQKTNINTAYSNIVSTQQGIASVKITNKTNLDTAEGNVDAAKNSLQAAQDNLALVTAQPREGDIALYQAKAKSSQARVDILENQIADTVLRSPVDAQIIDITELAGEIVQPTSPVVSILPLEPFQVRVDIYEEDIVKVKIGNSVRISLVAFPKQLFDGKVIFINPSEKLVDEVVYYEVTIDFEQAPAGLKPGMSADIAIVTASKDGVLVIPKNAVSTKNDQALVKVLKDKKMTEKPVALGLQGIDDAVEVISGLREGEEIIID